MAENKTKATNASVQAYFAAIDNDTRRKDCEALAKLMTRATKHPPTMWGSTVVGFGSYHYKYDSGREGDSCLVGFSSRQGDFSVYGLKGTANSAELPRTLGKRTTGKGCVYIKTLADVALKVLAKLVASAAAEKKPQQA